MKKILIGSVSLLVAILVYWLFFNKENPQEYINHISLYRHERAEFFRYSPESPFISQKVDFKYIDYYPVNTDLKIKARFEKSNKSDTVGLATSTGTIDTFIISGTANFEIQNEQNTLLVLASINPEDKSLFIPFLDKTSGETTYGGGRYLDVYYSGNNYILLDFNKSYNPYCAYTDGYTCPFPPKDNRLNISIEAGEKSYPSH